MTCLWGDIPTRMNITSRNLQSVNIDIGTVCEMYESIEEYFKVLELLYDCYEEQSKNLRGLMYMRKRKGEKRSPPDFSTTVQEKVKLILMIQSLSFKINHMKIS